MKKAGAAPNLTISDVAYCPSSTMTDTDKEGVMILLEILGYIWVFVFVVGVIWITSNEANKEKRESFEYWEKARRNRENGLCSHCGELLVSSYSNRFCSECNPP